MPRLKTLHLDDFTLLRYTASDLDDIERRSAEQHLETCAACSDSLRQIEQLHEELERCAREGSLRRDLPPEDPFHARPEAANHRLSASRPDAEELAARAFAASEQAGAESVRVLQAARSSTGELAAVLSGLSFSDAADRYALLYALQEAGGQIAESPVRALAFAEEALNRLRRDPSPSDSASAEVEAVLPLLTLFAQAHFLAGQASIWIGEFERAGTHIQIAYRGFAGSTGDEVNLALVEHLESQRRSFSGRAEEGLVLARRAAASFESLGLEDSLARAQVSQGIALSMLGRDEEALEAFRAALPVFENQALWSNYVGAVNSVGACLVKLGRLDEARREYARALRRCSREEHRSLVPFIRHGLATVLFSAKHYREAALAFSRSARLFRDLGLRANALTSSLFETESWALSGDLTRASHRLEILRKEVARESALDPSVRRQIEGALSGQVPDIQKIADLRKNAEEILRGQLLSEAAH